MKPIALAIALLLTAPAAHAAPPQTKLQTAAEPQKSMAKFIAAIKAKNRPALIDFLARGGVKFVNTSFQKADTAEKIEFSDLKNQFSNQQGNEYHSLVDGTIYSPAKDGQIPAPISVAALLNAKWTLTGDKFSPAKSQGIQKPNNVWVRWGREGKVWRVVEVALPYPVLE